MSLATRLAGVTARLSGALGEPVTFRAASVSALIDRSPRPDKLPPRLLDLDDDAQAVVITLPLAAVSTAPVAEEYLTTATHRYRIHQVRHLGHAYECACIASSIT